MQDSSPNVFAWLVYRIEVFGRGGGHRLGILLTLPQNGQYNIIYHLISTTWFAPPSRGRHVKQGQQQEPEDELKQQQWQEEEEEENTHEQRDARV